MSREHVARPPSPAYRPRAGSGNPTIGRAGTSATRISSRDLPPSLRVAGRPLHPQPQRAGFGHRPLYPREGERLFRGPGSRLRGGVALQGASRSNAIGVPPLRERAAPAIGGASSRPTREPLTRRPHAFPRVRRRRTRSSWRLRSWRTARTRRLGRSWRSSPRRLRPPPGWKTRRGACTRPTTGRAPRRRSRSDTSRARPSAFWTRPSSSTTTT